MEEDRGEAEHGKHGQTTSKNGQELQVIETSKNFVNKQRKLFKAIAAERLAIIDIDDCIVYGMIMIASASSKTH